MSQRKQYEDSMRERIGEIKAEYSRLRQRADTAETNLELEYYTLLEELQVKLELAEQEFELLVKAHEDRWEAFKYDLEVSWKSLRELIAAITSP